jgi:hypothetical protein
MLLMTRRNYPLALKRSTWVNRGKFFSDMGILIRTVNIDHSATTNVLHFLHNGTAKMMFSHKKVLSYLPVMLLIHLSRPIDKYNLIVFMMKKLFQVVQNQNKNKSVTYPKKALYHDINTQFENLPFTESSKCCKKQI